VLIFLRFIMGLGLGAENVVGYSTMTEFIPPQARGKWLGGMSFIVVLGLPATALVGTLVIPIFGWRAMFVIGGLGALVVWYLRKALPESPRWLESIGRYDEAEALLQSIEAEVSRQHGPLPPPSTTLTIAPSRKLNSLLSPALFPRMIVGSITLITVNTLIRLRYLAPNFLRSQRPHHRPILQLLLDHFNRSTHRLRDRSADL
jgi:putative MFS transporter